MFAHVKSHKWSPWRLWWEWNFKNVCWESSCSRVTSSINAQPYFVVDNIIHMKCIRYFSNPFKIFYACIALHCMQRGQRLELLIKTNNCIKFTILRIQIFKNFYFTSSRSWLSSYLRFDASWSDHSDVSLCRAAWCEVLLVWWLTVLDCTADFHHQYIQHAWQPQ